MAFRRQALGNTCPITPRHCFGKAPLRLQRRIRAFPHSAASNVQSRILVFIGRKGWAASRKIKLAVTAVGLKAAHYNCTNRTGEAYAPLRIAKRLVLSGAGIV